MSELANYSIETDHTVLLAYKDGRKLRVPIGQLGHYLKPPDLAKVRAAIKLRRDFIRRHMPKTALVLMAGGLIALLVTGGQVVAHLISRPAPLPPPADHSTIVRSQYVPTPAASPLTQPSVASNAKPKFKFTTKRSARTAAHSTSNHAAGQSPVAAPTPAASPGPIVDNQPPSPTPEPTPQIPNQGQVLGDCTGPDSTNCVDPGSTLPVIP